MDTPTPHPVPTETDLSPEEKEERAWASFCDLFNRRHKPKRKRASRKPEFIIHTQPVR